MKSIAGSLRLELAQFRELAAFSQFSTDLDPATKQRIERGRRITELLKQGQYEPLGLADQVVALLAVTSGALDTVPVGQIKAVEAALQKDIRVEAPELLEKIQTAGQLTDQEKATLTTTITDIVHEYVKNSSN